MKKTPSDSSYERWIRKQRERDADMFRSCLLYTSLVLLRKTCVLISQHQKGRHDMKAVGIIAEYNPFHNGHKYQIEQARRMTDADYVIVVMSGSFVQRGTPAWTDKYLRTQIALELSLIHICISNDLVCVVSDKMS